jgi:XTP/dITP diphosphohydrolase
MLLLATSNPGKLRDFAGAAAAHGISMAALPQFSSMPEVIEDGDTFETNARKKAEHYSRFAPGEIVLADDSGLEVDALNGAPGVLSARYAATTPGGNINGLSSRAKREPSLRGERESRDPCRTEALSQDAANNARLLRELAEIPDDRRSARFVCVLAAARDGRTLTTVRGEVRGRILHSPRGSGGFGYDPLFLFPSLNQTFAELAPEEKASVSHRGAAFRNILQWYRALPE